MRTPVRLLVPLTTLGLALAALPAVAGPPSLPDAASGAKAKKKTEQPAATAPFDYIAQAPALSQPTYPDVVT